MAQSFCQIYGHLVFSTHKRLRWLDDKVRDNVHAYLAGSLRNMSCADVHIGGPDDHIHAFFLLPKTMAPATLIQEFKQESSKYVKTLGISYSEFSWQRGYAIFSVSPTARNAVINYISKQVEHHRKMTFKDELIELLKKAHVDYNEKYLWD